MPARLVQVTLINNSDFPITWKDDSRNHGFWQDPWYPSKIGTLRKGEQGSCRLESRGVSTGVEGSAMFTVDVPPAGNVGVRTEFFNLWWERPYIGHFAKNVEYTLQHPAPALAFVKDHGFTDIANMDSSPFEFLIGIPTLPIVGNLPSMIVLLNNDANAKHVAWLVEVLNTGVSSALLPLQVAAQGVKNDILWYNSSTGETQIWFMDGHRVASRATVLGENGSAIFIGPPWRIVGTGDFNGDGKTDILWANSSTGEIQIWFMDGHTVASRATVLGENGSATFIGPPWSIVGTGLFFAVKIA